MPVTKTNILNTIKKYKIIFPLYMLYIIVFYMFLGMGDDIWDELVKKLK